VTLVYTWSTIVVMVLSTTVGDILLARAMKHVGDLGELRRTKGLLAVIRTAMLNLDMLAALFFFAVGFFTLLISLSWADLSLVVPATASLTFVTNAIAAKLFLGENVDGRRWLANILVCAGVALLAK
jgi:drug/metabolite transporter (DMT)-like permease